jgi:hypothetical protein
MRRLITENGLLWDPIRSEDKVRQVLWPFHIHLPHDLDVLQFLESVEECILNVLWEGRDFSETPETHVDEAVPFLEEVFQILSCALIQLLIYNP